MLAHVLAVGLLTVGSGEGGSTPIGTVTTSPEQTVVLKKVVASGGASSGIPLAAAIWPRAFDPSDRAPYAFDWSLMLGSGESIADIRTVTMSALGASLGVRIDDDSDRLPMIDTAGKKAGLYFKVEDAFKANAAFTGAGSQVGVTMLIRTDAVPYNEYEQTLVLLVRQR